MVEYVARFDGTWNRFLSGGIFSDASPMDGNRMLFCPLKSGDLTLRQQTDFQCCWHSVAPPNVPQANEGAMSLTA